MEYIYAALVLHEAGTDITEGNLTSVLEAAGIDVEEVRVKALVSALEDVDIGEVVGTAAVAPAGAPAAPAEAGAGEAEAEEVPAEEE